MMAIARFCAQASQAGPQSIATSARNNPPLQREKNNNLRLASLEKNLLTITFPVGFVPTVN